MSLSDFGIITSVLAIFGGFQLWAVKLIASQLLNDALRTYASAEAVRALQGLVDKHYEEMREKFHESNAHMQDRLLAESKLDGRISRLEGK